jgi:hypothetical protein
MPAPLLQFHLMNTSHMISQLILPRKCFPTQTNLAWECPWRYVYRLDMPHQIDFPPEYVGRGTVFPFAGEARLFSWAKVG